MQLSSDKTISFQIISQLPLGEQLLQVSGLQQSLYSKSLSTLAIFNFYSNNFLRKKELPSEHQDRPKISLDQVGAPIHNWAIYIFKSRKMAFEWKKTACYRSSLFLGSSTGGSVLTPILAAVPATILIADSVFLQFKSGSFSVAIARSCPMVIFSTFSCFASLEPFSTPKHHKWFCQFSRQP